LLGEGFELPPDVAELSVGGVGGSVRPDQVPILATFDSRSEGVTPHGLAPGSQDTPQLSGIGGQGFELGHRGIIASQGRFEHGGGESLFEFGVGHCEANS
jgi:hypothetical protein